MNEKLIRKLAQLTNRDFWKLLIENKELVTIILDNDQTIVAFNELQDEYGERVTIDAPCVGNTEGIFFLLETIGFNVEHC